METLDHFKSGDLREAIKSATANVKSKPTDTDYRALLSDLHCFAGDYERADKHLEAITTLAPGATVAVSLIRQLIRGEKWRLDFYRSGRPPEFLGKPEPRLELQLRASIEMREGHLEEASKLLAEAEEMRGELACAAGETQYSDLRDCDDLLAGVFEVFTSTGKYYWIPMERVIELEPRPIERPRDYLWRQFRMEVKDGPQGEIYLPSIYCADKLDPADTSADAARLGRVSEFTETEPVRGIGRRLFLLGDEAVTVDQLPELTIANREDS